MNRLFDIIIVGVVGILILFFLLLIGSMLVELGHETAKKMPDVNQLLFAVKLSLYTATCASFLAFIVSVPTAYLLSRYTFFGKNLFDTLLDLPIVLSPIALGAMLLIFFNTALGREINTLFGPFVFEVKGIILAQFVVIVGLSIRLMKTAFEGIDVEYENLARSLGYNKVQVFFSVLLPMSVKSLIASLLLVWGRAIGEFGATVTLAGATTLKTETIPIAIYLNFESVDIYSALIFIILLISISFLILLSVRKANVFGR